METLQKIAVPALAIMAFLGLWEFIVWVNDWPNYKMASPSDLPPAFARYSNLFIEMGWQTLWRTVAGLGLAVLFGTLLGMAMGFSRIARDALYPLLVGFNAIPKATLVPVIALIFIGLPFVVRTVQPILEDMETELEEVAASLGARRWQTFRHVVLPILLPALLTGFALAFARAVGEYGSVIFIAGNIPYVSEITPLMIITKLEQYDYTGATAIAVVMLLVSFTLLLVINGLQAWAGKRTGRNR